MNDSSDWRTDTRTWPVDPGATATRTLSVLAPAADVDIPRPGDEIGHYTLVEEVGRGGMGVVYRARNPRLGREIALKVLCTGRRLSRERFVREGKVTAQLQHPATVPVHSIGETAAGLSYYTMRLVLGHTFDDIIKAHSASDEAWTGAVAYPL